MEDIIRIRAHHLLCIPRFYHGGYDEDFAENMKGICSAIRKHPDTRIKVLNGELDDLCRKCPFKYDGRCVQSEEIGKWVIFQDRKVVEYLGVDVNATHTARDIFNLSMDGVNEETIRSVCEGCIFLDNCIKVGINNAFRKDLNRN